MKKIVTLEQVLSNKNFRKCFNAVVINDDKPITITEEDWNKVNEGEPQYTDAKIAGRSGVAIAKISPNTLAVYTSEDIEYPYPINWSDTIQNSKINEDTKLYNRSHLIGYKLSAKNPDSNNIFIGTDYMNKITMKDVEKEVCEKVKKNNITYLYKVTPMYIFEKDTIPIGVLIEAEPMENIEKESVCRFCYNIQKGVKINYYDGSNKPIEKRFGTLNTWEIKQTTNENKSKDENKFKDYYIDVRNLSFHLQSKNCSLIEKVDKKYIQETRACEDDIISKSEEKGYKLCEECN